MKQDCVSCGKEFDTDEDGYFVDYSLGSYWCLNCAEQEGEFENA